VRDAHTDVTIGNLKFGELAMTERVSNTTTTEIRLTEAVDKAQEAFWASIVQSYPESTHGDIDPLVAHHLSETMKNAVRLWVGWNCPAPTPDLPDLTYDEAVTAWEKLHAEWQADSVIGPLMSPTADTEAQGLKAIRARHHGSFEMHTGGGCYVSVVPIAKHAVVGVNEECTVLYYNPSTCDPEEIFCNTEQDDWQRVSMAWGPSSPAPDDVKHVATVLKSCWEDLGKLADVAVIVRRELESFGYSVRIDQEMSGRLITIEPHATSSVSALLLKFGDANETIGATVYMNDATGDPYEGDDNYLETYVLTKCPNVVTVAMGIVESVKVWDS
jgi:hypothetical protein